MVNRIVVWDFEALDQLKECYDYLNNKSIKSAKKVKDSILAETRKIAEHPEKFPLDKFKIDNDGYFRAFEKYNFRISYRINQNEIRILRIRHIKRNPLKY